MSFSKYIVFEKSSGRMIFTYHYSRMRNTFSYPVHSHVHFELPEGRNEDEYELDENGDVVEKSGFIHIAPWMKEARIYKFIGKRRNPLITDFTIVGLQKESPSYHRGRKWKAEYLDPDDDSLVVEKLFDDVRNGNGRLTGITIVFNWYNHLNEIVYTKTEVSRKYNPFEAETEERKRRERQIDYLIAGAKDSPIAASMMDIFHLLEDGIKTYKDTGDNSQMVTTLDSIDVNDPLYVVSFQIPIPRVDDPSKIIYVHQSIKYQIGAMTLEQIEAANGS